MALFKNKETDKKRKGENVIGKIIYAFLLFAPLMSILFTSLYTVFNKNAFESYYGENINQSEKVVLRNIDNINNNTYYKFQTVNYSGTLPMYYGGSSSGININGFQYENSTIKKITFYHGESTTDFTIWFRTADGTAITSFSCLNPTIENYDFQIESYFGPKNVINDFLQELFIYHIEYNKYSYLDNAFEYGMYKTEQSNIYNWSKTTGTYTVMQNVCTGIGITNTFTPMLMAYWLIISIIYFIFDIALILIWAVHDKIHELKDSI